MKKIRQAVISLGLILVLAFGFFTFTAASCDIEVIIENPINRIEIEVPYTTVYRDEEFSLSGAFITVYWVDTNRAPQTVYFTDNRVTHTQINPALPGDRQNLRVDFVYTDSEGRTHNASATIRIYIRNRAPVGPTPTLSIVVYELPQGLRDFNLNTIPDNNADFDRRSGFIGLEGDTPDAPIYYIGAQNDFRFFPNITIVDEENRLATFTGFYESNIRVYKRVVTDDTGVDQYVYLGDDLDKYVDIDAGNGLFNFSEYAINENYFFRITQQIAQVYDVAAPNREQFFNDNILVLDNIRIIDAFNAHCIEDLSLLDNRNTIGHWDNDVNNNFWADERSDIQMNGLVLHNNITLTDNDIPLGFFYNQDRTNGLRNHLRHQALFLRVHDDIDTPFVFVGNYFTVNSEEVSHVTHLDADLHGVGPQGSRTPISRISLFAFIGVGNSEVLAKNVYGIGNAPRNEHLINARGLKFARGEGNITFENIVITAHTKAFDILPNSYINPFLGRVVTLRQIRSFDTWQQFAYIQQHDVNIYDSIVLRTGGPALLIVERFHDETSNGIVMTEGPSVNMFNTQIINYNTANAAWFTLYNLSSTIMQFYDVDDNFLRPMLNRTMMRPGVIYDQINFVAFSSVYTLDGQLNPNTAQLRSTLTLDGNYLINHIQHVPNNPLIGMGLPPLIVQHSLPLPPFPFNQTTFPISPNHMSVYVNAPVGGGAFGVAVTLHNL
ncbi:MAG: hypothetical protein FWE03_03760 [Firmicutes bacterium]|nr:hypothetical protein [Bacillota bacterium]